MGAVDGCCLQGGDISRLQLHGTIAIQIGMGSDEAREYRLVWWD